MSFRHGESPKARHSPYTEANDAKGYNAAKEKLSSGAPWVRARILVVAAGPRVGFGCFGLPTKGLQRSWDSLQGLDAMHRRRMHGIGGVWHARMQSYRPSATDAAFLLNTVPRQK
jgi:hypothetical protein